MTTEDILRNGLEELTYLAPGLHSSPCYDGLRRIKDHALRVLAEADAR